MQFPIIDISTLRMQCEAKAFVLDKFHSLSSHTLEILIEANQYLDGISQGGEFTTKSTGTYRSLLVQGIRDENSAAFHHHLKHYQKALAKKRIHTWHLRQQVIFNDESLWKKFRLQCKTLETLAQVTALQKLWQHQKAYASYSSEALIEVA